MYWNLKLDDEHLNCKRFRMRSFYNRGAFCFDGICCHTGSMTDVDVMLAAYEGRHSLRLGTKENILYMMQTFVVCHFFSLDTK